MEDLTGEIRLTPNINAIIAAPKKTAFIAKFMKVN